MTDSIPGSEFGTCTSALVFPGVRLQYGDEYNQTKYYVARRNNADTAWHIASENGTIISTNEDDNTGWWTQWRIHPNWLP